MLDLTGWRTELSWRNFISACRLLRPREEAHLLLTIGIIFLAAWLLGLLAFHVSSGLIHLVLVLAVISFIAHFFTGRRGVA